MLSSSLAAMFAFSLIGAEPGAALNPAAPILDKQKLLDSQSFWDNRDWDWYRANVPFFECPDPAIVTTYYYRWELITKHMTYGSPTDGYAFTEFIDRPFWSGRFGSISCPAGLQLYELRWLRDPRYARDYARYWFRTQGAQPRRYSCWLADATWAGHQVHPDPEFLKDLLPDLKRNYEGWEQSHFDPKVGLFRQTGHDDGMEININSRQTQDTVRGAPGFRPTLNSYLWADALAIAKTARLAGDSATADAYEAKAKGLKANLQSKLWDPQRRFFLHMAARDETHDGHTIKAGTLTYQTGKFAGDPHGRELIGYVPWMFGLPDSGRGYEESWSLLMSPDGFYAKFGPTTTERHDPLFLLTTNCCVWSGQSWPYAASQTLTALANLLNRDEPKAIGKEDYAKLLKIYAETHRKQGRPYIAEGCNPDTGSWEGYDGYNHSEHYFHSNFNDLIITGLAGLRPRDDQTIEVNPLTPAAWDWWAITDVPYRGHEIAIVWDRDGKRYGLGPGLRVLADGRTLASAPRLGRLTATLPPQPAKPAPQRLANFAVNNDKLPYPKLDASYSHAKTPLSAIQDGNYWYHLHPPNRWTTEGSPNSSDWVTIDFGQDRTIATVKLYVLDDEGGPIRTPKGFGLDHWDGGAWRPIPSATWGPAVPTGHRANVAAFPPLKTSKIRVRLDHDGSARSGLSEIEAWEAAK